MINELRGSYPFLKPVTVAANQLQGQHEPIETLGAEWLLVCRSDLSEDLVYQLTRAFFEQLPAMARDHGEAALIDPEQAPAAPDPAAPRRGPLLPRARDPAVIEQDGVHFG